MADDGMLLNFELPSDAFAPKKTFKGGSWKDRLTAKKSAAYGRKKAQERAGGRPSASYGDVQSEDEELILPQGQPNKRAKTGEHGESKPRGERGPRGPHRGDTLPKTTNGEVISSLFTYNPSTTPKQQHAPEPAEDEAPVEPSNAPLNDELSSFTTLGLSSNLASHLLRKMNIQAPTAIQRKAVSQLCGKDSDAFIQAQTGSGKTLAYLLPIVQRITDISKKMHDAGQDFSRECGLFAIVLAPTRELSKQISTVLESLLSCCHWIVGGTVIGGEKKKSEKARLRKGLNILVATPGRLADHLNNTEVLDVSRVRWLVLDEGDRLMELGFENDIQKIVSVLNLRSRKAQETPTPGLPDRRTTVLCSATIKANVEQLRSIALKDPASIAVDAEEAAEAGMDTKEQAFTAPAQLKQSYAVVPAKQRLVTLVAVLKQAFKRKGSVMKSIVFMSCADSVDFHFELLTRKEESKSKDSSKENQTESAQRKRQAPPKLSKSDKIPQGNTISEARTYGPATAVSSPENDVQVFRLHGSLQQATR
ncbi:putative ATP dependent RNA helicase, partial [Hortaea werneckii]